jgi:predicted amidohydrolase
MLMVVPNGHPIEDREVVAGIAQWLPLASDPDDAMNTVLSFVGDLAAHGCDLVVLPELWPCVHDPADPESISDEVRKRAEPLEGPRARTLAAIASEHRLWLAAGSVPESDRDGIFNTALLFSPDGRLHATHRKAHLYGPMHEDVAFERGERLTVCDTELLGRVGLTVCFDGDFPEVARGLRRSGARVVIQVNAYEQAVEHWWDRIYPAHALINGQWWVMANQCGTRGSTTFLGGSQIISPLGEVVAQAPKAGPGETPEPALLVHTLELDRMIRLADDEAGALMDDSRPELGVELSDEGSPGLDVDTESVALGHANQAVNR